jgi:hypothetical protein
MPTKPPIDPDIYTNTRVKFPARHIVALNSFAARNDIRYYLNGVYFEKATDRPGLYLVATNGHTMLVIYEPEGQMVHDRDGLIMRVPPQMIGAIRANKRQYCTNLVAKGCRVSLTDDFGQEHRDGEFYIMPGHPWIDGNFPQWRRVIPNFDKLRPGSASAVNSQYLANFHNPYRKRVDRFGAVRLWQEPSTDRWSGAPIAVQMATEPNLLGIIMPILDDDPSVACFKNMIHQEPPKDL